MNKLRVDYRSFKKLLETSGFNWNAVTRTCTVEDESLWEKHIKANPTWSKFRRNGLPQWLELQMIFGDLYEHRDGAIRHEKEIADEDEEIDIDVDQSLPNTPVDRGSGDSDDWISDFSEACKAIDDASQTKMQWYRTARTQ